MSKEQRAYKSYLMKFIFLPSNFSNKQRAW